MARMVVRADGEPSGPGGVTPHGLTLTPIGVGAAYARPGEAQSSYLVRAGGSAILLDLGAGALNRLQGELAPEALDAIVVTHLHPDHCADLLALRVYMAFGAGAGAAPLRVIAPEGLRARLVAFTGPELWDDAFTFQAFPRGDGELVLGAGVILRHAEVPHLDPTYALRVEHGGRALSFGADCGENEALVRLAEGSGLLLAECSLGAEPVPAGVPHLGAREAARTAERAGVGRLLLTHCFPEHDREAALAVARAGFAGPVDWARQGEAVAA